MFTTGQLIRSKYSDNNWIIKRTYALPSKGTTLYVVEQVGPSFFTTEEMERDFMALPPVEGV